MSEIKEFVNTPFHNKRIEDLENALEIKQEEYDRVSRECEKLENKIQSFEKIKSDLEDLFVDLTEYFEDRHDIDENGHPNKAMKFTNEIGKIADKLNINL